MIASLKTAPVTEFDLPVDEAPSEFGRLSSSMSKARLRSWAKRGKTQVVFNGPPPEGCKCTKTQTAFERRAKAPPPALVGD